jgi:hypothetical protein
VDPTVLKVAVATHDLIISLILYMHHTTVVQAAIKARCWLVYISPLHVLRQCGTVRSLSVLRTARRLMAPANHLHD